MQYVSLFSGAGGFEIGLDAAGLTCVAQVEIDAKCRQVLARHWPGVPKFADVRAVGKRNLPGCDVVVGGFPCQDISQAGKRAGLVAGKHSSLFFEMCRVIHELRPLYVVFENVPRLLSSDDGRDFTRVLMALDRLGYSGAGRVVDAQYFGVAQRRRRVFGVFTRLDSGARGCAEILAVREGMSGHPAPGQEAGEDVAGTLGGGTEGRGWNDDLDRAGTFVPTKAVTLRSRASREGVSPPGRGGEDDQNIVAFQCQGSNVGPMGTLRRGNGHESGGVPFVPTGTLARCDTTREGARGDYETCTLIPIDMRQASRGEKLTNNRKSNSSGGAPGTGIGSPGDPSPTLCDTHTPAIANIAVHPASGVRRLTPRECERLQGWPDDHTAWGLAADGKRVEMADGTRYRMIGNGVASPCAYWIGRRLMMVHARGEV
jgi:DNA (cytosine-5)-methyltransferase 1